MGIATAVAWGQAAEPLRKTRAVPDFDARSVAMTETSGGQRTTATAARRRSNIEAFLASENGGANGGGAAAPGGTRIVVNRHGLPKLLLRDGASLSPASGQEPEEIAKNFLRSHAAIFPFTAAEIDGLRLVRKDVTPQATFVAFNQTLNGIDVFEGQIKFTLNPAGEVVQAATGDVTPELSLRTVPQLNAETAVRAAFRPIGAVAPATLTWVADPNGRVAFANPRGSRYSPISTELSIFILDTATQRLAYRVFLEADSERWYEILIDAENGRLLYRHNLYVKAAQARVWLQSPMQGTRQLVTFPDGWLPSDATVTTGNNGDSYLDADGDDKPDTTAVPGLVNGRPFSTSQVFDFPFGDGLSGMDPRNFQPAAVTNLFYLINTAHDYYYSLGFNEAAGNFQTDNFGRGGVGHDAVVGEAQQGNTLNDAEFSPTPEGIPPKVRMGLFDRVSPVKTNDLDSDYDGQVLIHEYGHGVSNRLVGAGTSTSCLTQIQSGALGEGWSDYFSISFYNNPVEGAYLTQNLTTGARRQSYEGYTLTYQDIGNGPTGYEVHDDGEIWTGMLWDLRKSLGQAVTDQLVMNGLKSTPCNPSMTDARDAILSADQATNKGANRAILWQIFAKHGLGYSAAGTDGNLLTGTVYNAAYDQPPDLQSAKNPKITSSPLQMPLGLGDQFVYTVTASSPNGGTLNYALATGPDGMTVSATGITNWTASFTGQRVKIVVSDGTSAKVVHGFLIPVQTTLTAGTAVRISGATGSTGFAAITVPANLPVLQITLRSGGGDADLVAVDPTGALAGVSATDGNTETLSFDNPISGKWQIIVAGYKAYSGVFLNAALITPTLIGGNTTLTLNGLSTDETFYRVKIPPGATAFSVTTSGGTGDVDLFLRKAQPAVCSEQADYSPCDYDFDSVNPGNNELISVLNPAAADWYIDVAGFLDYSGVSFTTLLTVPPTLVTDPAALTFNGVESGSPPAAQSLALFDPSGSTYSWTATVVTTSGGNWLQVSLTAGSGDATVKVSANQVGLKAGTYQGTITLQAQGSGGQLLNGSPLTVAVVLNVTAKAVLSVSTTPLSFASVPGKDPAPQNLSIANTGGGVLNWTAATTTASGGNWLQVSPASGSGNGAVQVSVIAASLADGSYSGTIAIAAGDAGSASVSVSLTVAPAAPRVVNAASGLQGSVAPGETVVLYTSADVGPAALAGSVLNSSGAVDTKTGNTRVLFNGTAGPMIYAVAGQISAVVPYAVSGPVNVQVEYQGQLTSPAVLNVAKAVPAIFTSDSSGKGQAAALNEDGTPNSAANPAARGSVIVVFATGEGQTDPAGVDGKLAAAPLPSPIGGVVTGVGDEGAEVLYAGGAPGLVAGLMQVNARIPADAAVGDKVPLTILTGGAFSPAGVTIAVK